MARVLHGEHAFPQRPVVHSISDLVGLVREDRHVVLQIALVGDVAKSDVASEDAPPAIALEPVAGRALARIDHAVQPRGELIERDLTEVGA